MSKYANALILKEFYHANVLIFKEFYPKTKHVSYNLKTDVLKNLRLPEHALYVLIKKKKTYSMDGLSYVDIRLFKGW